VEENRALPALGIYQTVEEEVTRFQNFSRHDDFTLIVLKVL